MTECHVPPQVSKLIDQHLMAQTGACPGDLEDWLFMSDRAQPYVHVEDDPADFEDVLEDDTGIEDEPQTTFVFGL